jgi:hypothetical protein
MVSANMGLAHLLPAAATVTQHTPAFLMLLAVLSLHLCGPLHWGPSRTVSITIVAVLAVA